MFKEISLYNASEYIGLHHNYIGIGVETTKVYNIKTFASDMSRLEVLFEYLVIAGKSKVWWMDW